MHTGDRKVADIDGGASRECAFARVAMASEGHDDLYASGSIDEAGSGEVA